MNGFIRIGGLVSALGVLMAVGQERLPFRSVNVSAATSVATTTAEDVNGDVKALDTQVYNAIAARDAKRLAELLDDQFLLINTFGTVYDKPGFLAACCAEPASSKTTLRATDMLIKIYGDTTAVVVARTEMRFVKDNQNQQLAWRSIRVYVRSTGAWKLAGEQRTGM